MFCPNKTNITTQKYNTYISRSLIYTVLHWPRRDGNDVAEESVFTWTLDITWTRGEWVLSWFKRLGMRERTNKEGYVHHWGRVRKESEPRRQRGQFSKSYPLANPILIHRHHHTYLPVSTPNTIHHSRLTVCLPDSLDLDRCLSILFWLSACE